MAKKQITSSAHQRRGGKTKKQKRIKVKVVKKKVKVVKKKKTVRKAQSKRRLRKKHFLPLGGMPFSNGLMLRSPNHAVVVLRDETDKMEVFSFSTRNLRDKFKLFFIPFFRGIFFILENIYFSLKVFSFKRILAQKALHRKPHHERLYHKLSQFLLYFIYFLLLIGFFDYLYIRLNAQIAPNSYLFLDNFVITLLYMLFFMVLFFLVYFGRKGELELFAYHGLEHKIINAHEKFGAINNKTLGKTNIIHKRCSISVFFWSMVVLAFLVNLLKINEIGWGLSFLVLIGLVFISFSLVYELVRIASYNRLLTALFIYPIYIIQSLTSYEPDARHIHVGEVAYSEIMRLEREKD